MSLWQSQDRDSNDSVWYMHMVKNCSADWRVTDGLILQTGRWKVHGTSTSTGVDFWRGQFAIRQADRSAWLAVVSNNGALIHKGARKVSLKQWLKAATSDGYKWQNRLWVKPQDEEKHVQTLSEISSRTYWRQKLKTGSGSRKDCHKTAKWRLKKIL